MHDAGVTGGEDTFEQFFDLCLDLCCIAGVDGYFKRVNRAFDVLGYTHEELLSRPFLEFVHPEDREAAVAEVAKLASGASTTRYENRTRCKDGSYRWLSWMTAPRPSGLLFCIARDVTETKALYAELSRQKHEYQAIFDTLPQQIWVKDADSRIVRANRAAVQAIGRSPAEIEGQSTREVFPERAAEHHRLALEGIHTGQPRLGVLRPYTQSGGEVGWVSTDETPYWDAAGEVCGVVVSTTDVTDWKRREDERARLYEQLQALDLAKTEFFANVSHELRTPLTLILGPLEEILGGPLDGALRDPLETARRNALRLQKLVNTLLDFARIEAGRANAHFEPTELAGYTRELASFFDSAVRGAGLDFEVECAPLDEPAWVDRELWEKIVTNLLSNALKFTLKGAIRLRLRSSEQQLRLEIEDTGAGIAAAELPRIFERFHRVRGTPARGQEGSGIGLALVQALVRMHGGSVQVSSTEGEGSRFVVSIPRGHAHLPADHVSMTETPVALPSSRYTPDAAPWTAADPRAAEATRPVEARPDGTEAVPPRARVVIADDNADMRAYLGRMLQGSYEVEACADGVRALEAIRRRLPDVVITDVMMPGMNGFELLAALRADPRTQALPIVMVSARAGEEARVAGIEAGADDYLVKPFSARELLARVRTQWALAQMRKASARHAERVARLAAEQHRLEAVLDRTPMPLLLLEPDSARAIFANRAANEMAGGEFPLDASRGGFSRPFRLTDELDRDIPLDQWPSTRAARGEKVAGQLVVWHSEAGRFPVLVSGEMLPATSEYAACVVVAFQDVSDLVRAIRARDEFLSIASHELRTPLTSMKLQVQRQARALSKQLTAPLAPAALADTLAGYVRQVDRLSRLVEDILDVSRIATGHFSLAIGEPIDLVGAVRDEVERSAAALAAAGCPVTVEGAEHVLGRWDGGRIEQLVLNLLTNAWKYGRGKPIHLAVRSLADRAVLTVRDEGIGISAADQERIFRLYERGVSKDEVSGLGLGLYIARRIVEAHGGAIHVESEPARGATFTVELPFELMAQSGAPS